VTDIAVYRVISHHLIFMAPKVYLRVRANRLMGQS